MDVKNLVMAVVGMVLAAVMIGAALLPAVGSAMTISGEPVTYTNTGGLVFREVEDGDVLVLERNLVDGAFVDTVTLNGEPVAGTLLNTTVNLVLSDGFYFRKGVTTQNGVCSYFLMTGSSSGTIVTATTTARIVLEFGHDTVSATKSIDGADAVALFQTDYTWAYVASPLDSSTHYVSESGLGEAFVKKDSRIILCGAYQSGELDTLYTYYDGVMTVYTAGLTASYEVGLSLVDGTTDIYRSNPVITVTDGTLTESFTPYRYLVPLEVNGHASSGVSYTLFGVMPIIVIAGLVMAGIYVFISRK